MTEQEFFARIWEMLIGSTDGPPLPRLILEPILGAIFAVCAGLKTRGTRNETTKQ